MYTCSHVMLQNLMGITGTKKYTEEALLLKVLNDISFLFHILPCVLHLPAPVSSEALLSLPHDLGFLCSASMSLLHFPFFLIYHQFES